MPWRRPRQPAHRNNPALAPPCATHRVRTEPAPALHWQHQRPARHTRQCPAGSRPGMPRPAVQPLGRTAPTDCANPATPAHMRRKCPARSPSTPDCRRTALTMTAQHCPNPCQGRACIGHGCPCCHPRPRPGPSRKVPLALRLALLGSEPVPDGWDRKGPLSATACSSSIASSC